jgi:hypothetical protein
MTTRSLSRSVARWKRGQQGFGMIQVMGIGMIITILAGIVFTVTLNELRGTRRQRNITTAVQAAEAGVEQAVFELGRSTNWDTYPVTYASGGYTATIGDARYTGSIATDPTNSNNLILTMTGNYPIGSADTRTLRVVVTRQSPPGLDYTMFAQKGIDIHHHGGDSYLAPEVVTPSVHSNGFIQLNNSSNFHVTKMEAVGALEFHSGGGKTPAGDIPTTGYNWQYVLPDPDRCFPGGATTTGTCPTTPKYSGHATITGESYAGSVVVNSRGNTLPGAAISTATGVQLPATFGDVKTGSAKIGTTTYNTAGTYTAANCSACGKGTAAQGGQLGGSLRIQPGYTPPVLPFPSIDYSTTYRARALSQPGTHVFNGAGDFWNYITNPANGFYRIVDPTTGVMSTWSAGNTTPPGAIFLDGDWDILNGDMTIDWGQMLSKVKTSTGLTGLTQPPVLVVRGSLIVEAGSLTIEGPLVVVGKGNRVDFLKPGPDVDLAKFLDPNALEPGVLAAGTKIDAHDYDTDKPWTAGTAYEPLKISPVFVRGLAYAGKWDPATKKSIPGDQHWHNYDPKNLMRLFGSQVGDTLHDCNNFNFTYDPLVKKAFGVAGGTVAVVDWQEI